MGGGEGVNIERLEISVGGREGRNHISLRGKMGHFLLKGDHFPSLRFLDGEGDSLATGLGSWGAWWGVSSADGGKDIIGRGETDATDALFVWLEGRGL